MYDDLDDDCETDLEAQAPVLIVGLGREDRRDAGLGIIAARVLKNEALGEDVEIMEAGPGLDLILELEDRFFVLIIVAARMGLDPGAMRLMNLEGLDASLCEPVVSLGGVSLADLVELGGLTGGLSPVSVLAVEPEEVAPGTGLTVAVGQALPAVVAKARKWLNTP
jgi:hydrogenase maturation protease